MSLTVVPFPARASGAAFRSASSGAIVHTEGTRTVVVLAAETAFSTVLVLADALSRVVAKCVGDVVVDLSQAKYFDSGFIPTLQAAQQLLGRQRRTLTFRSPSRLAELWLDLFGLTDLIEARQLPVHEYLKPAPRYQEKE